MRSYAVEGLIRAVESWQPWTGAPWGSWAWTHMRGNVLEGWRHADRVPRRVRRRCREFNAEFNAAAQEQGAIPSDRAVFDRLGYADRERRDVLAAQNYLRHPLEMEPLLPLPDPHPSPLDMVERDETSAEVSDAVSRLPERHKIVVTLHYYHGMKWREIGPVLGVGESMIYVLHRQALGMLRADPALTRRVAA